MEIAIIKGLACEGEVTEVVDQKQADLTFDGAVEFKMEDAISVLHHPLLFSLLCRSVNRSTKEEWFADIYETGVS